MLQSLICEEIAKLESTEASQDVKLSGYQSLLPKIIAESESDEFATNLRLFVNSVLSDNLSIVAARPIVTLCVEAIRDLADLPNQIKGGKQVLQCLGPRVASFEDQDTLLRQILADAYQEQGDFIEAARALQGIAIETLNHKFSDEEKIRNWIRICRLYLEEEETTNAESYLNRAKTLLYKFPDQELNLTFQLCQARVLDSNRKFLEACQAYESVSLSTAVAEEERNMLLSKAIICAVLAPAGPQRSRALSKLYRDERASQLDEFGILEKMFLDRLIAPHEVKAFADKLTVHQLAQTSDGSTVLDKAVVEHNLLGASKLYSNLELMELGRLINLDAENAERHAAKMLEQKRLPGTLDQIQGIVFFGESNESEDKSEQRFSSAGQSLRKWDHHVQSLVEDVERVSSILTADLSISVSVKIRGSLQELIILDSSRSRCMR